MGIYQRFLANLMNKEVDLEADTIKVMLLNSSHSFNAAHNTKSQVDTNEIANGNGYTTGGATLANKAVTQAATTKWDADDVEWEALTAAFDHAVIYDNTLTNDDLIASISLGAQSVTGVTVRLKWDVDGIITLTEAA